MEESQLGGILSRAKGLMAMDEEINKIASSTRKNTSKGLFDAMDEFGGIEEADMSSYQPTQQTQIAQSPVAKSSSKLPKEILESMTNNPIDTSIFDPNRSVLDRASVQNLPKVSKKVENKNNIVTEQVAQQQTTQQIDYSLIKSIVEECVRKYAGAISKKILKESKGEGLSELKAMKVGNKFSFITENGDVYEATLKFKKNINEG